MTTFTIDNSRGFDVLRYVRATGKEKVLAHFDTLEEARAYAAARQGLIVRYWDALDRGTPED